MPLASLEQKHPVSLLGELASKRRWGAPNYTLVHEQGPAHAKSFVFKVSRVENSPTAFEIQLILFPVPFRISFDYPTGPTERHRLHVSNARE